MVGLLECKVGFRVNFISVTLRGMRVGSRRAASIGFDMFVLIFGMSCNGGGEGACIVNVVGLSVVGRCALFSRLNGLWGRSGYV